MEVCHGYGVPVIVDEAHGAHWRLLEAVKQQNLQAGQRGALGCGVDVVVQSAHKTLGALTQTGCVFK